jgi:hypothetical protein
MDSNDLVTKLVSAMTEANAKLLAEFMKTSMVVRVNKETMMENEANVSDLLIAKILENWRKAIPRSSNPETDILVKVGLGAADELQTEDIILASLVKVDVISEIAHQQSMENAALHVLSRVVAMKIVSVEKAIRNLSNKWFQHTELEEKELFLLGVVLRDILLKLVIANHSVQMKPSKLHLSINSSSNSNSTYLTPREEIMVDKIDVMTGVDVQTINMEAKLKTLFDMSALFAAGAPPQQLFASLQAQAQTVGKGILPDSKLINIWMTKLRTASGPKVSKMLNVANQISETADFTSYTDKFIKLWVTPIERKAATSKLRMMTLKENIDMVTFEKWESEVTAILASVNIELHTPIDTASSFCPAEDIVSCIRSSAARALLSSFMHSSTLSTSLVTYGEFLASLKEYINRESDRNFGVNSRNEQRSHDLTSERNSSSSVPDKSIPVLCTHCHTKHSRLPVDVEKCKAKLREAREAARAPEAPPSVPITPPPGITKGMYAKNNYSDYKSNSSVKVKRAQVLGDAADIATDTWVEEPVSPVQSESENESN